MSLVYAPPSNPRVDRDVVTLGPARSFASWVKANTQGSANAGTIVSHGTRSVLAWNGTASSKKLRFTAGHATDGRWEMSTGFGDITPWRFIGVTYDGTSLANHPILYTLDGAKLWQVWQTGVGLVALTRTQAPAGAEDADAGLLRWGNNTSLAQDWDGRLAHLSVYTRILTAQEMRRVADAGPLAVARGAYLGWGERLLDPEDAVVDPLHRRKGDTTTVGTEPLTNPPTHW